MTTRVYRGLSRREHNGWILGLTVPQVCLVVVLAAPVVWAISASRWADAAALGLLCGLLMMLVVVPLRGRPAARWLGHWALYQLGVLTGWSRWQSRAAAGVAVTEDEPDLPGELTRITMPDGPPFRGGHRVCLLHDTVEARWGAIAQLSHSGVGLSSDEVKEMLARRLGSMLRSVGQHGILDRVSVYVRSVPDDGTRYAVYRGRNQVAEAPRLAVEVTDELDRSVGSVSVAHEVFITVSASEDALRKPAQHAGGGIAGRAAVLHRALDGLEEPLRGLGATSVHWLDSAWAAERDRADEDQLATALRSVCSNPQDAVDHLIGAWRLIDTMSYGVCRITGRNLDEIHEALDRELIRIHHDERTDTVPARLALRCLNNDWYPELNNLLGQLNQEAVFEMLTSLLYAEHHMAVQFADLNGQGVIETIEHVRDAALSFDSTIMHRGEPTYDPNTGSIAIGQDKLGAVHTIRLHDPHARGVNHVFILGDEQGGKSNSLRVVALQAAISGVFRIFPADPRNEHNFSRFWQHLVGAPSWIATNVSQTLDNLETMTRIIDSRSSNDGYGRPASSEPGILFALDDADDILAHPRGHALIERIVKDGPPVCVALAAVLRDLNSLMSETLLRALAEAPNKVVFGSSAAEALDDLETTYRT